MLPWQSSFNRPFVQKIENLFSFCDFYVISVPLLVLNTFLFNVGAFLNFGKIQKSEMADL